MLKTPRPSGHVWAPFRRSYRGAIGIVRAHVETLFEPSVMDPRFSVKAEMERLPWAEYERAITSSWEKVAGLMLERSRNVELQVQRSKRGHRVDKVEATLADELAVEWMETRGLSLAENQSARAKRAMVNVFRQAIVEGWSMPKLVREIRDQVGLHEQDRDALAAFKDRLGTADLTARQERIRTERYRNRLIDQRSELIARTEIKSAEENGKLHAWREMAHQGEIPRKSKRAWVLDGAPCAICQTIAESDPVPIGRPFRSSVGTFWAPPAHPRCECSTELVDE